MADVTISQLESGKPSNSALMPYTEGGVTKAATVSNFGVPVGAVFHLATSTVPVGYLKCNGVVVPNGTGTVQGVTADFSALYAVLGATYGSAGKVPDLRGEFVRGFDDGRNVDTGRTMGSYQIGSLVIHNDDNDSFPGGVFNNMYFGEVYKKVGYDFVPNSVLATQVNVGVNQPTYGTVYSDWYNALASYGGAERWTYMTRPRNVALMPVIKY